MSAEPEPPETPKPAGQDDVPGNSWGNISEHHWTRSREGQNQEAIDYYRERSKAPGVEAGGGMRAHYCMKCKGVIPLEYDQRVPASEEIQHCPHCGVELDQRVREMFNWVEIDQPPASDFRALLPILIGGVVALVAIAIGTWLLLR